MVLKRDVPASLTAALAEHFHPVVLIHAVWPDGPVRLHSGVGALSWAGETWSGVSVMVGGRAVSLAQMELPGEAGGLATGAATVHVAALLEDALAQRRQRIRNLPLTVWFSATTEAAGTVLVAEPVELFHGYFSSRTTSLAKSEGAMLHDVQLGLGIGPSARAKASITHSLEDQERAVPGDTAGRHVQHAIKRALNPSLWPEP